MNEIEEIKQKLDIVELAGQYVTLKKAGANYKAACPFHQEKTASLMVSPEKQIWKCFGCGKGGSVFDFVMEAEHLEFGDALKLLAQKAGVMLQSQTRTEYQTKDRKETLYQINRACAKVFQTILLDRPAGAPALAYLKKRGLTLETIKQFGIGYVPSHFALKELLLKHGFTASDLAKAGSPEKFFDRIMFPIFDVLSNTVGFTGRIMGSGEPKYLNSPETPIYSKSRVLYGLNLAKGAIKEKNYVVLVEGQMDVVALHQAGTTNTVASSGTAITDSQLQLLSKYTPNFLLAFDNDPAGLTVTKKVIELLLKLDLNSKVISFGQYKDAGELLEKDPAAWAPLVKTAQEGIDWWIDLEIAAAGQLDFIENKKKVIKAMLPVIAQVSDPTRLDHYAQRLALAIGVKSETIYESLRKVTRDSGLGTRKVENQLQVPRAQSPALTNEEQLLALALAKPALILARKGSFESIAWQSAETSTVAETLQKLYNDTTLVKTPTLLLSKVKNNLGPDSSGKISATLTSATPTLAEKIDGWQFWLSGEWPELTDETADQLIDEKLARLATKKYEAQKESLARDIKRAQEAGDIKKVKELMGQLSQLTAKQV